MSKPVKSAVQHVYNHLVRPRLPRRLSVKSGVAVKHDRLLDTTWVDQSVEEPSVSSIREHTSPGDDVVIIGGGLGVTPVHAARKGADVTVFEAARRMVDIVNETADLNFSADAISVHHALVATEVEVWGDDVGKTVDPADLPDCDILEIDAEGAETAILDRLTIRPRVLIVEAHPPHGVEVDDVREELVGMGYEIDKREIEVPDEAIVLTAIKEGAR